MKLQMIAILLMSILILSCAYVRFNPETKDFKYYNWKKLAVDVKYKNIQTGEEFQGSLTSDPSPYIELMKYAFDKGFAAGMASTK